MDDEKVIHLKRGKQRLEAVDADMSGSRFTDVNLSGASFNDVRLAGAIIHDANLSGISISNADLRDASIADSLTNGMTIEGIAVTDLFAAYQALHPKK